MNDEPNQDHDGWINVGKTMNFEQTDGLDFFRGLLNAILALAIVAAILVIAWR